MRRRRDSTFSPSTEDPDDNGRVTENMVQKGFLVNGFFKERTAVHTTQVFVRTVGGAKHPANNPLIQFAFSDI